MPLELIGERCQYGPALQGDAHVILLDGGGAVGSGEGLEVVLREPLGLQLAALPGEPAHGLVDLLWLAALELKLHPGAGEGELYAGELGHPPLQQALQYLFLHAGRPVGDEWRQFACLQPVAELLRLALPVLPADVELTATVGERGLPAQGREAEQQAEQ